MASIGAMEIEGKLMNVVASELPADLETPVSAFLKLRKIGASFLLESAEGVDRLGRFSFIGFASRRTLTADTEKTIYTSGGVERSETGDPLMILRSIISSTKSLRWLRISASPRRSCGLRRL